MANKKISELDSRASLSLSDLMAVGDPATGYLYKTTISDLKTLTGAGVISFNGRVGVIVPTEGDYNLTQLGDVIITSVTSGQFLRYNGSNFVNTGLSASDIPDLSATYQPLDGDLTTIAGLTGTGILKRTGSNTWSLLTDNTANWDTAYSDRYKWDGGSTGLVAATGRTSLGLVIGTDVQAWDADLDAIAALAGTSGFLKKSAANTWSLDTNTYLTTAAGAATYEPIITAGTTAQYWRGDKTWQTLPSYSLPIASATILGGIKVGSNLSINTTTGVLDATFTYTLPVATTSILGGVKIGSGVSVDVNGVISVSTNYQSPITLTTTGTSGAATLISGTLNIPNYAPDLSGYIPYTGATTNVVLGSNTLQVNEKIGTTDNKGIYLRGINDITHKIYFNTTILANIWESNAPIKFQAYTVGGSATKFTFDVNGDFTAVGNISGANLSGTNTGDQTLSGLGGVPTSRTLTINGTAYDLSANRSWTITAGISGSGTATRVAFFDGTSSITSSSGFYWDNTNGRLAVGRNTADARLEVYGGTKGQIRANGGTAMGGGLDIYTELSGADRRNWGLFSENTVAGDFELVRSASAGSNPTVRTLSFNKSGEGFVYNLFSIVDSSSSGTGFYLDQTARTSGRNWSLLNGNTAVGDFSIKDETATKTRFKIATDGVVTSYVSAAIGIETDAALYMRISENQIWRTGGGTLYINSSSSGQVVIANGGGAITLGTDTQQGSYAITTKNAGITGNNFYFGTGAVRIGGGADHTTNTVLSVAPGVVNFDRPGVAGGAYKIASDGKSTFGCPVTIATGSIAEFAFGVNSNSTFAFGSTNGRRAAIIAHESTGDSGLQFGWDTTDKTGIIAGSANSTGAGIDFYTYDGSSWANRMRLTKTGQLGIGVNPSTSDWTTRSVFMLGTYGTSLSSFQGGGGATELCQNAIVTTGFNYKYAISASATKQYMDGNTIAWYRAPIGTAGATITFSQLANLDSTGLAIGGSSAANLKLSVFTDATTISGGDVTFTTQAKGIELYNTSGSGTTDSLVGYWFSTGPHKSGIASGRTNAASNWAVDLRFFVHGTEIANLDHTYEKMRLGGDGTLVVTGDVVAYGSPSDLRLKIIKEKVPNALESVLKLNGYRFDWKETNHLKNYKEDIGVIAQEVEALFPELARTNSDGYMSVRYQGLTAVLIEAIKEQQKQIDQLKNRN